MREPTLYRARALHSKSTRNDWLTYEVHLTTFEFLGRGPWESDEIHSTEYYD